MKKNICFNENALNSSDYMSFVLSFTIIGIKNPMGKTCISILNPFHFSFYFVSIARNVNGMCFT
jgi:hypothetical protein